MGGVGLIPPKGGAGKEEGQRSPGNQTVGSEGGYGPWGLPWEIPELFCSPQDVGQWQFRKK